MTSSLSFLAVPLVFTMIFHVAGAQERSSLNPADEALIDAAQRNDLLGVAAALDEGANVNAESRFGIALLHAARHSNLEMVKFLVERGADVTIEDRFGSNALGSRVTDDNVDQLRYLISKGTPVRPGLVTAVIKRNDARLLPTVLARARVSGALLAAMHALNAKAGNAEITSILREAMDARPGAANAIVTLSPGALHAYTGRYVQDSNTYYSTGTSHILRVEIDDGQLKATIGGGLTGEPDKMMTLFATSELTFVSPEMPDYDFRFEKRGDVMERMFVNRPLRARDDPTAPYVRTNTRGVTDASTSQISAEDLAVAQREAARPWPSFRGIGASGVADGQGAVAEWDVTTGRNIRWKTTIPGIGNSSPVVWDDRVFITSAISRIGDFTYWTGDRGGASSVDDLSEHTFKLYALDARTGDIVWEREAHKGVPRTKRHGKASHAISTPATDGQRLVVLFGTAGLLLTYDLSGELLWKKDLGLLDAGHLYDAVEQWGHASSPIIYEDSVILQVDRQKQSFITAYDLTDGSELWRTPREDEIPTWGTPNVVTGPAGDELVTNGTMVRGYDPKTGELRWRLGPNPEITIATPIVGDGLVYVTAGYPPVRPIYAIRPGARGDISLSDGGTSSQAIAWSNKRDGAYIPTPVYYRGLLYSVNNNGILTVFEGQTGERVYRARVGMGGSYVASPVAADGRLYFANEEGEVFVVRAGGQFVQIAKMEMNDVITATPAISDGVLIIRTMHDLYAIGEEPR